MKLTPRLTIWMQQTGAALSEDTRRKIWFLIAELCYLHYDIHRPFSEQFAENTEILLSALPGA